MVKMMNKPMKDLIEKLTQYVPSRELDVEFERQRELDVEIVKAMGWQELKPEWFNPPGLTIQHHITELPRYTASIDAALTLVPEGKGFRVQRNGPYSTATIWRRGTVKAGAATPAIALCIAALSAKEPSQ